MVNNVKELVKRYRSIIDVYKEELAKRLSAALSSFGEEIKISPNSKLFNLILAIWFTYLIFGDTNITLGHIAWAWWVLFKTSPENILTIEEVMTDPVLKNEILQRGGKVYEEVRRNYYWYRRQYDTINKILLSVSTEDQKAGKGKQKKVYNINTSIILKISEVMDAFVSKYNKQYGHLAKAYNSFEKEEVVTTETISTIEEDILLKLGSHLLLTPLTVGDLSIEDASIILYLRNDPAIFLKYPEKPPVDEILIDRIAKKLFENPLYTTLKIFHLAYTSVALYTKENEELDNWDEILQNIASKPFFIITDEEFIQYFDPSTYYKLLGFIRSPAPGTIELVRDVLIVNYEPVSFDLFGVHICNKGHVIVDELNSKTKVTVCPYCGESIFSSGKLTFSGIKAELMSSVEGSLEHPKEYTVLFPKPLWDLLIKFTSVSLLLVKVKDVGKGKAAEKKPVYYPLVLFVPRYERRLASNELKSIEFLSRLKTWQVLAFIHLAAYGSIRGAEHTILASILTAFSQGKQHLKIEEAGVHDDVFGEVLTTVTYKTLAAPLNMIVLGETATAKTTIAIKTLEIAAPDISKGLCYVNLPGTSRAGIFMGIDKQSRSRIKLGSEPINDGRIVVYDEADKLARMNNRDEIVSMFLSAMYDGRIALVQIKRSERPTRVARIFLLNTETLQRNVFSDVLDIIDTLISGVPSQGSRSTIKIFGEVSDQFLSRIDFIVYHPRHLTTEELVEKANKAVYAKYKPIFRDIADRLLEILQVSRANTKEIKMKVLQILRKYFIYVRDSVSNKPYVEVPVEIYNYLVEELKRLEKYTIEKFGSIDAVPALKYLLKYNADRRKESLLKIARAIAHIHLRNDITEEDVKEAIAFSLFIHSYPFLSGYDENKKKATLNILSIYKDYLGLYYDLAEFIVNEIPSPETMVVTEAVSDEQPIKVDKREIRNKQELYNYLLDIVKQLKEEGLTTPDGVSLIDIADKIYHDIINNTIIVTCTARECKEFAKMINLVKQLPEHDAKEIIGKFVLSIYSMLNAIGSCVINTRGNLTYIDAL